MNKVNISGIVSIIVFVAILLGISMWGIPRYRIYKQDLKGQAELRQQEWEKKILVEEAKAQKESATLYAAAEVERAKGVAEANRIIADGLKGNEEYLRYLWITNLDQEGQVIYIPTEAGIPILEAGRR
ncbi:hypothetical protein ACFLY7_01130 [Patescibacteria group bacterium]